MTANPLPVGVDPLPITLRVKDLKHQILVLGGTLDYLLKLVDPREVDDEGNKLTLKPKARANKHLFKQSDSVLFAIDVRNVLTHPGEREFPPGGDMQRARDKLHRAIYDLFDHVPDSVRIALLKDPNSYEAPMPLGSIDTIPDPRRKLVALRNALDNHLRKIDADEGFPRYALETGDFVTIGQRLRRHFDRFSNLNFKDVEQAIDLADHLEDSPEDDVPLSTLQNAGLWLSHAVEQAERSEEPQVPDSEDDEPAVSISSDTLPNEQTISVAEAPQQREDTSAHFNGNMVVSIPLWTDVAIRVRTRTLLWVALMGWVVAGGLVLYTTVAFPPDRAALQQRERDLGRRKDELEARDKSFSKFMLDEKQKLTDAQRACDKERDSLRKKLDDELAFARSKNTAEIVDEHAKAKKEIESTRAAFGRECAQQIEDLEGRKQAFEQMRKTFYEAEAPDDFDKKVEDELANYQRTSRELERSTALATSMKTELDGAKEKIQGLQGEVSKKEVDLSDLRGIVRDVRQQVEDLKLVAFPSLGWDRFSQAEQALLMDRVVQADIKFFCGLQQNFYTTYSSIETRTAFWEARRSAFHGIGVNKDLALRLSKLTGLTVDTISEHISDVYTLQAMRRAVRRAMEQNKRG